MKIRWLKRLLISFGALLLLAALWGLAIWLSARSAQEHLELARAALEGGAPTGATASAACAELEEAAGSIKRVGTLTAPAAPLLRLLGFVPRYGPKLKHAPANIQLGVAFAELGQELCRVGRPTFAALDGDPQTRNARMLQVLQQTQPSLAPLRAAAERALTRWQAMSPAALEQGPLAPFAAQLQRAGELLPELPQAITTAERVLPIAGPLLGLDEPRRLLILGQNPMELRATGGFIGSLGTLGLAGGRVTEITYHNSGTFNTAAPAGSSFPAPYARYLRASQWYLRDANWWADFPTSARTIEAFWAVEGQPAVDGVVAVDIFALQEIVRALGGVEVPAYGLIPGEGTMESVFLLYEARGKRSGTDKAFLAALLRAVATRMQDLAPSQLPALAAAMGRALDERHVSIYLHDAAAAGELARLRWDGGVRADEGDYLQVVDADLSYSDVQAYIEEQIAYDVVLDQSLRPLTGTLTITLTNHYDSWGAARSAEQIYGYCYNTASARQERIPGCYGDYVRAYLPSSAAVYSLDGADGPLEPDADGGRGVWGAYVLLYPGETRTLSLAYLHAGVGAGEAYTLTLQKQAGTLARPLSLTIRSGAQRLALTTDLWTDRQIVVGRQEGHLVLRGELGPRHPLNSDANLGQSASFERGRALWLAGSRRDAVALWSQSGTLPRAVRWARARHLRGEDAEAEALIAALRPEPVVAAHAAYVDGELREAAGEASSAIAAYQEAARLDPENPAPHWALADLHQLRGAEAMALEELRKTDDPLPYLRRRATDERAAGERERAAGTWRLLLQLAPDDRAAHEELYATYRYVATVPLDVTAIGQVVEAALQQFPAEAIWYERRAEVHTWNSQPALALADLEQTVAISRTSNVTTWLQLGRLRWSVKQDQTGALEAYATLRRLQPAEVEGYLEAARLIMAQQPQRARALLEQGLAATAQDPRIMEALAQLEEAEGGGT